VAVASVRFILDGVTILTTDDRASAGSLSFKEARRVATVTAVATTTSRGSRIGVCDCLALTPRIGLSPADHRLERSGPYKKSRPGKGLFLARPALTPVRVPRR
jgi:hypothetical protein